MELMLKKILKNMLKTNKTNMNPLDQIDEHEIIRETVGYEFLNNVELCDIPEVMKFLKIVYNYKKIKHLASKTP